MDLGRNNSKDIPNSSLLQHGGNLEQEAKRFDSVAKQYVVDKAFSNEFIYNETVHAAYIQYGGSIGFFGINAGGRYETVDMLSELKTTNENLKIHIRVFILAYLLHLERHNYFKYNLVTQKE